MKKNKSFMVVLVLGLAIIGAVLLYVNWDSFLSNGETNNNLEIDSNAGKYTDTGTQEPKDGGIVIPGWGSITIPAGKREAKVNFFNPSENAGKYYLTFELRLKKTDEILYKSGLVEPGLCIQRMTMSHALKVGNYKAIIRVQPYLINGTKDATNNADVETELVVK